MNIHIYSFLIWTLCIIQLVVAQTYHERGVPIGPPIITNVTDPTLLETLKNWASSNQIISLSNKVYIIEHSILLGIYSKDDGVTDLTGYSTLEGEGIDQTFIELHTSEYSRPTILGGYTDDEPGSSGDTIIRDLTIICVHKPHAVSGILWRYQGSLTLERVRITGCASGPGQDSPTALNVQGEDLLTHPIKNITIFDCIFENGVSKYTPGIVKLHGESSSTSRTTFIHNTIFKNNTVVEPTNPRCVNDLGKCPGDIEFYRVKAFLYNVTSSGLKIRSLSRVHIENSTIKNGYVIIDQSSPTIISSTIKNTIFEGTSPHVNSIFSGNSYDNVEFNTINPWRFEKTVLQNDVLQTYTDQSGDEDDDYYCDIPLTIISNSEINLKGNGSIYLVNCLSNQLNLDFDTIIIENSIVGAVSVDRLFIATSDDPSILVSLRVNKIITIPNGELYGIMVEYAFGTGNAINVIVPHINDHIILIQGHGLNMITNYTHNYISNNTHFIAYPREHDVCYPINPCYNNSTCTIIGETFECPSCPNNTTGDGISCDPETPPQTTNPPSGSIINEPIGESLSPLYIGLIIGGAALALIITVIIIIAVIMINKKKQNDNNNNTLSSPLENYTHMPEIEPDLPEGSYSIDPNKLVLVKLLGEGAFGEVHLANYQNKQVAVKIPKLTQRKEKIAFLEEIEVFASIPQHQNVVHMVGYSVNPLMIIVEYLENGSLEGYRKNNIIPHHQIIQLSIGIAKGLDHLHSQCGMVHRDMAMRNILLDSNMVPKVSDFGLSRKLENENQGQTASDTGPIRWMSPENISNRVYSSKSDIWAYAITIWEIYTGKLPYYESDQPMQIAMGIMNGGLHPTLSSEIPESMHYFFETCWVYDPQERPTLHHIIEYLESL